MPGTRIPQSSTSGKQTSNKIVLVLFLVTIIAVLVAVAHAQTYRVLHSFGYGYDGQAPLAGVIMDASGNLWGTTEYGGIYGAGTIFMLAPDGTIKSYSFTRAPDGANPQAGLLLYHGALYGIAEYGGAYYQGTIFKLDQHNHFTVLYSFTGKEDGVEPSALVLDPTGNLYGTCVGGGANGLGTVFKLDTNSSFTVLYSFAGGTDGSAPNSILLDAVGNLYGTTGIGGDVGGCRNQGCGTVFRLDPAGHKTTVYRFGGDSDGAYPNGMVKVAHALWGTTHSSVPGYGTVFELTPKQGLTTLYNFSDPAEGENPYTQLFAGNQSLYGTTDNGGDSDACNGYGCGVVFQLNANGMKTLHAFNGSDGKWPLAPVFVDAAGNIYGTTSAGGDYDEGVVYKIIPQ